MQGELGLPYASGVLNSAETDYFLGYRKIKRGSGCEVAYLLIKQG